MMLKLKASILLILAASADAARPLLSMKVQDGTAKGFESLDPSLTWESSSVSALGCDLGFGAEIAVRPSTDVASLPKAFWGKLSKTVAGWGVSMKADIPAQSLFSEPDANVGLSATNDDLDLGIKMTASKSGVSQIEAEKGIEIKGSSLRVNPHYSLADSSADVVISYNMDDTGVKLYLTAEQQSITISQRVSDSDTVTPTVTSEGKLSVDWEHKLDGDSSLLATLKPNDSLNVLWTDGPWKTNINAPLTGAIKFEDVTVGVKRDLGF